MKLAVFSIPGLFFAAVCCLFGAASTVSWGGHDAAHFAMASMIWAAVLILEAQLTTGSARKGILWSDGGEAWSETTNGSWVSTHEPGDVYLPVALTKVLGALVGLGVVAFALMSNVGVEIQVAQTAAKHFPDMDKEAISNVTNATTFVNWMTLILGAGSFVGSIIGLGD